MTNILNIETTLGALNAFMLMQTEDQCMALNCNKDQLNLLTGGKCWLGGDRVKVKRLLEQAIEGQLAVIGLPSFALSAEYIACVIWSLIHPVNWMAACHWIANSHRNDQLGNFDGSGMVTLEGVEKVTPQCLFAHLVALNADERPHEIAKQFARKSNLKLGCLVNMEINDGTQNKQHSPPANKSK